MSKNRPKSKYNPHPSKKPRFAPQDSPDNVPQKKPVWLIGKMDMKGPWGWENIATPTDLSMVRTKLSNFENMKWGDIDGGRNHNIPVSNICKKAQKRLTAIKLDEFDILYSLHLDGKKRVWGIRDNHVLKIIWWDPDHTVCPVKKRHT